ncbi:hypothetical protein AZH53_05430 [Methanomicrobiaceae archaeon CYW5]|uniref:DUF7847 domain-containing protein n=1 Tax=Methanovulcanius yangii TaxID=1789227 RepID=UPI0029CA6F8B|nr:hypothetical protein [Methanovulcanius yangii]MBT8507853.1 hypothetical protein [Methanovulcanius yangii]
MAFQSLRGGFQSIRRYPVILLAGLAAGIPLVLTEYFMYSGLIWYGEAAAFFGALLLPFFVAASLGVIREGDGSLGAYFREGRNHYFRVLLPGIFIAVLALVSGFIVMTVLGMVTGGADPEFGAFGFFWVAVPLAFFFFLYDTAAVFGDLKLFASLSRSAQVVLARPFEVFKFIMVSVLLGVVIIFGLLIIGSVFLAGSMSFDETLTTSEVLNMTPEEQEALIGEEALFWFTIIYAFGVGLFTAVFIPFKAAFYQQFAEGLVLPGPSQEQGVYDEKGRWYKYS